MACTSSALPSLPAMRNLACCQTNPAMSRVVKYLREARPRANQNSEAPIIIVLSTSKNAAAVGSGVTAGGGATSAAAAEAAPATWARVAGRRLPGARTGARATAVAARDLPAIGSPPVRGAGVLDPSGTRGAGSGRCSARSAVADRDRAEAEVRRRPASSRAATGAREASCPARRNADVPGSDGTVGSPAPTGVPTARRPAAGTGGSWSAGTARSASAGARCPSAGTLGAPGTPGEPGTPGRAGIPGTVPPSDGSEGSGSGSGSGAGVAPGTSGLPAVDPLPGPPGAGGGGPGGQARRRDRTQLVGTGDGRAGRAVQRGRPGRVTRVAMSASSSEGVGDLVLGLAEARRPGARPARRTGPPSIPPAASAGRRPRWRRPASVSRAAPSAVWASIVSSVSTTSAGSAPAASTVPAGLRRARRRAGRSRRPRRAIAPRRAGCWRDRGGSPRARRRRAPAASPRCPA